MYARDFYTKSLKRADKISALLEEIEEALESYDWERVRSCLEKAMKIVEKDI